MSGFVELARRSVEEYVVSGRTLPAPVPLTPELTGRSGVFVCIKKQGQLRGCIGTFMPCCENAASETIRNAIAAATQDPRFPPVAREELQYLSYTVDVLSPPEPVKNAGDLDPKRYGIVLAAGGKKGLLLPDLDGVDTVEEQIRITRMKAGIFPGEPVEMFRFTVTRHT